MFPVRCLLVRPKNLFLITFDAMRADAFYSLVRFSADSDYKKFVENSVIFTNTFSNGPGTVQSFPAIMTSNYFLYHCGFRLNPIITTLAECLSRVGYRTVGFNSNEFLTGRFGYSRGFDEYYDFESQLYRETTSEAKHVKLLRKLWMIGLFAKPLLAKIRKIYFLTRVYKLPYLDASTITSLAIYWLKRNKGRKVFMWLHYMDTHFPYAPPDEFLPAEFNDRREALAYHYSIHRQLISKGDIIRLWRLYLGEVRYIHSQVAKLLEFLEESGVLEESIIIMTADHGDAFGEHGYIGHEFHNLYNELLKVPLLIFDNEHSGIVDKPVFLIDIMPTILSYVDYPDRVILQGRNLLGLLSGESKKRKISFIDSALFCREHAPRVYLSKPIVALVDYPWKLIYSYEGHIELYDIASDPKEKKNLATKELELTKRYVRLIRKHIVKAKIFRSRFCVAR